MSLSSQSMCASFGSESMCVSLSSSSNGMVLLPLVVFDSNEEYAPIGMMVSVSKPNESTDESFDV